jgi:hypothetical protein
VASGSESGRSPLSSCSAEDEHRRVVGMAEPCDAAGKLQVVGGSRIDKLLQTFGPLEVCILARAEVVLPSLLVAEQVHPGEVREASGIHKLRPCSPSMRRGLLGRTTGEAGESIAAIDLGERVFQVLQIGRDRHGSGLNALGKEEIREQRIESGNGEKASSMHSVDDLVRWQVGFDAVLDAQGA